MKSTPAEWIISLPTCDDWHDVLVEWCEYMHEPEAELLNKGRGIAQWREIAIVASQALEE